jgi:hypothetical protein
MSSSSSSLLSVLSFALVSALVGCGGNSQRDGDPGASGGAGAGRGGTGGAGTGSGTTGSGATGSGATGSGGTGAAGGGNANGGAAGEPSAICSLPAEGGECDGAFPRFFHNAQTGSCESFVYGGCGGNENNFETFEACEAACGSKPLDACTENSDCTLTIASCCGVCEPSTLDDWVAVHVARVETYRKTQSCTLVDCPAIACEPPPPEQVTRTYFAATCQAGRCKAIDLRTTKVTACEAPSDCSLRHGARCCEACGDGVDDLLAVSDEAALADLVCGSEPAACPPCVPIEPEGYVASCEANRCVVEVAP